MKRNLPSFTDAPLKTRKTAYLRKKGTTGPHDFFFNREDPGKSKVVIDDTPYYLRPYSINTEQLLEIEIPDDDEDGNMGSYVDFNLREYPEEEIKSLKKYIRHSKFFNFCDVKEDKAQCYLRMPSDYSEQKKHKYIEINFYKGLELWEPSTFKLELKVETPELKPAASSAGDAVEDDDADEAEDEYPRARTTSSAHSQTQQLSETRADASFKPKSKSKKTKSKKSKSKKSKPKSKKSKSKSKKSKSKSKKSRK